LQAAVLEVQPTMAVEAEQAVIDVLFLAKLLVVAVALKLL